MKASAAISTILGFILSVGFSCAGEEVGSIDERSRGLGSRHSSLTEVRENASASFLADTRRSNELLDYARGVFLARLGFGQMVSPPESLQHFQHGCFVTLFSGKTVIGCFGNFYSRTANIADEVDKNITMALLFDQRARHIDRKVAMEADIQITFPGEPRPVTSYTDVDPRTEGLLVENDREVVAIVPGEAKTAAWAFREAMRRLGEKDENRLRLYKFRAVAILTVGGKHNV